MHMNIIIILSVMEWKYIEEEEENEKAEFSETHTHKKIMKLFAFASVYLLVSFSI